MVLPVPALGARGTVGKLEDISGINLKGAIVHLERDYKRTCLARSYTYA